MLEIITQLSWLAPLKISGFYFLQVFNMIFFACLHSGPFLTSLVLGLPFYLLPSSLFSHPHTSFSECICLLFWGDGFWLIPKNMQIAITIKTGRPLWEAEHFLYHNHDHYFSCFHCLPFIQLTCQNLAQLWTYHTKRAWLVEDYWSLFGVVAENMGGQLTWFWVPVLLTIG